MIVKETNTVGIRELKQHLGYYVALLRRGERLIITDRGEDLATIVPSAPAHSQTLDVELEARLAQLEREGFLRRGTGKPLRLPRPIKIKGGPMSDTVLEDRR